MKGPLRIALFVLFGLVVGLPIGFAFGYRSFHEGPAAFSDALALAEYESLTSVQYQHTDPAHAKAALLDLLEFMDEMEANHRTYIQKQLDLDRGVTYTRLSLVEQKAGDTQLAEEDIRKAQEAMKKRDGKDISAEDLREQVTKLDSMPQFDLPGTFLLLRGTLRGVPARSPQ